MINHNQPWIRKDLNLTLETTPCDNQARSVNPRTWKHSARILSTRIGRTQTAIVDLRKRCKGDLLKRR